MIKKIGKNKFGIGAAVIAGLFLLSIVFSSRLYPVYAALTNRLTPIYCVQREDNMVSLSFDAAWGSDKTRGIMDILDQYGIKATFFLVGFWVDNNQELVKEISDRGHEIGSHSISHPHMSKLSKEKICQEVMECSNKIEAITGKRVWLFRPPFGDYNNTLVSTCFENGVYPIQWDVDSLDWKDKSAEEISLRINNRIKSGSIVLFHNNSTNILTALPLTLELLIQKKFLFCPIGELVYKDNFYIDSSGMQCQKSS